MILRALLKDSFVYGGSDFFSKVIAFLTFPFIAAALTPEEFGAMELIGTAASLLGVFANCGLNNAVNRFYWDKDTIEGEQSEIVTSGFFALAFLTGSCVLVVMIAMPWLNSLIIVEKLPFTWVALIAVLFGMVFTQWTQYSLDVIRLHFAPFRFMMVSLSSRVLSVITGLLAVLILGWRVDGLLAAQSFIMLIVVIFAIYAIKKDFKPKSFNWKWLKELVQFGYPFIFAGLAYWLFGAIDRWMLATYSSVEEVGIYSVAFRFASIVVFISSAFGQAWSPFSIKLRTDHPEAYREIYGQVLILLLFAMIIVGGGLSLFSGEMISLLMPAKYASSALPLSVLSFGIIVQASQQVTAVGISLEKKTFLFARLIWVTAGANSLFCFVLIPNYGSLGAAWATTISHLLLTVSYMYFTQKLHPLKISWSQMTLTAFLLSLFILVSVFFSSNQIGGLFFWGKVVFYILSITFGYFFLVKQNLKIADVR